MHLELICLVGRAAFRQLKERGRFQNVNGDRNRWFDKGFTVSQFFADAFSLKSSFLFVKNLVLFSQGFAASSSQV
jgi:hypothetical protein